MPSGVDVPGELPGVVGERFSRVGVVPEWVGPGELEPRGVPPLRPFSIRAGNVTADRLLRVTRYEHAASSIRLLDELDRMSADCAHGSPGGDRRCDAGSPAGDLLLPAVAACPWAIMSPLEG